MPMWAALNRLDHGPVIHKYTMRAREFTINVPINIKISGDGEPEIDMGNDKEDAKDPSELDPNPTFVPPLQQQIELQKAEQGKQSPIIKDLTQDEEDPEEDDENNPSIYK
jgi:hypothetical protein